MFKNIINFNSNDPIVLKRSKNIVTILIFSVLFIFILIGLLSLSNDKNKIKIENSKKNKNKIEISNSLNVKAEDEWINKSENDINLMREEIILLKKTLEEQKILINQEKEKYGQAIDSIASRVANIDYNIHDQKNFQNNNMVYNEYGEILPNSINQKIETININLSQEEIIEENNNYNDLANYIPAGSYVVAKMLSGADVSTGVSSQNDPNNMMFEIISPAFAPKYKGKNQEIKKVEGCRIMGAAIGQLWSEKAYIRLLKMSCSFEKGKVAEFNVKGYVTSFAKEGVRGKIVSREGYFTSLAFLAGAIEGIADVTQKVYSPTIEFQTGIATEKINTNDVARQGFAGGFGKSAEMLSDYFIKRSEQYQSVVEVPTGIEVEIVFQEGVNLKNNNSFKIKPNEINKNITEQAIYDMKYINNNQVF